MTRQSPPQAGFAFGGTLCYSCGYKSGAALGSDVCVVSSFIGDVERVK